MRVIYVAGPFRASNAWEIEQNIRRVETIGLEVAKCGAMPLMPHTNTRFFHGTLPDQFWLDGTLALLYKCDAALFIEGWQTSSGCRDEHEQCLLRGIPVVYGLSELAAYLNSNEAHE